MSLRGNGVSAITTTCVPVALSSSSVEETPAVQRSAKSPSRSLKIAAVLTTMAGRSALIRSQTLLRQS